MARELATHLEKAGFDTWDPADARFPGDNWALRIGKALQESEAMVVLISPDSMKSQTVRQEIDYALGSPQYKGRLIPVVVKATSEIPWILKKFPSVSIGGNVPKAIGEIAGYLKHGFQLTPANS
jgi:hypothetical protein